MRIRLWLGVGSWVMASSLPAALPEESAWAMVPPPLTQTSRDDAAGEGGEAGGAAASSPPATVLSMQAHLAASRKPAVWDDRGTTRMQVDHGRGLHEDGEAAFAPPSEAAGRDGLTALRPESADAASRRHRTLATALDDAAKRLRSSDGGDLRPGIDTVMALLAQARKEYDGAVADGRIKEPLEYHDSRGLFLIARRTFDQLAEMLRHRDEQAAGAIAAELDRLAATWPAIAPPPAPVMSPSEVAAAISRIELAATPLRLAS